MKRHSLFGCISYEEEERGMIGQNCFSKKHHCNKYGRTHMREFSREPSSERSTVGQCEAVDVIA